MKHACSNMLYFIISNPCLASISVLHPVILLSIIHLSITQTGEILTVEVMFEDLRKIIQEKVCVVSSFTILFVILIKPWNNSYQKLVDTQYFLLLSDRLAAGSEPALNEDYAFHIKTHPALKEFPPHYPNGFKLLVSK